MQCPATPCACRVGDAVFGQATGCLGTAVVVDARTVVAMPPGLTFVQAATVPTVFLTARYCLVDVAAVGAADRVLVHAATGAPPGSVLGSSVTALPACAAAECCSMIGFVWVIVPLRALPATSAIRHTRQSYWDGRMQAAWAWRPCKLQPPPAQK